MSILSQLLQNMATEFDRLEQTVTQNLLENNENCEQSNRVTRPSWPSANWDLWARSQTFPSVDVSETGEAVTVRAEVPGVNREDLNVEVESNHVVISGSGRTDSSEHIENYVRRECHYEKFSRRIPFPCEVNSDKAKATYKDGVLVVWVPKTSSTQARRIKVE